MQEVIKHRSKTTRNQDCTPGYYNFEGESNRRQDGNYDGGFRQYFTHMGEVRAKMEEHFIFTKKSTVHAEGEFDCISRTLAGPTEPERSQFGGQQREPTGCIAA
ncbi:MAG: hypothetical protein HYZ50_11030 [Deltaproteobacteria bacterium]|nr:hypothetical protein [Deltaproteobacteria bacterium]